MTCILGDSRSDEILALACTADVLIVDPPYSADVHDRMVSVMAPGGDDPSQKTMDRDPGFEPLTPELREAIAFVASSVSRWSVIFSDWESVHVWRETLEACCAEYVRVVPWCRWSQPQLSGDRPPSGSEAVIIAHSQAVGKRGGLKPKKKAWNGDGSLTHFDARCMRGKIKHPTEKPIDLMLTLVSAFSAPGDLVVDLCGGSGATALACRLLNREALSVEIDPKWDAHATRRETDPLDMRDEARAREWVETQGPKALALTQSDYPGATACVARGGRWLADVERVRRALGGAQ